MTYLSHNEKEWYELSALNLSGTQSGGTSLNIPTVDTWTTLARFDRGDVNLDFILYRSSVQDDATLTNFNAADGTSSVSLRILPPNSNQGMIVINNLTIGTDAEIVGLVQSDFSPSRAIPRGSLLQGKVSGVPLVETTGTDNRMYLHFAFEHNGYNPSITDLTDF